MPAARSTRAITIAELRAECLVLERAVLSARLTTGDEVKAHRPASKRSTAQDWLGFYRWLHRLHATGVSRPANVSREDADRMVLDALRAEPVRVKLAHPPAGVPSPLFAHPKSLDTYLRIHGLDTQLAWLTCQYHKATPVVSRGAASPALVTAYPKLLDGMAYTTALLCWIITHAGPGMPYADTDLDPEPPAWTRALEPWDVIRILDGHRSHHARLAAVQALIDEHTQHDEPRGQRPSWSMFVGTMANELGEQSATLMRHTTLGELLASTRLSAAAKTPPPRDTHASQE